MEQIKDPINNSIEIIDNIFRGLIKGKVRIQNSSLIKMVNITPIIPINATALASANLIHDSISL